MRTWAGKAHDEPLFSDVSDQVRFELSPRPGWFIAAFVTNLRNGRAANAVVQASWYTSNSGARGALTPDDAIRIA